MSQTLEETIQEGDNLPCGLTFWTYNDEDGILKAVRIGQFGLCERIIIIGVVSSFTPDCWNTHLHQVLSNLDHYAKEGVKTIFIIATDDPFVMSEWKIALGLPDIFVMLSDRSARFTQRMGLGHIHPRMNDRVRCRRFIILADNMRVKQLLLAPDNGKELFICPHLHAERLLADRLQGRMSSYKRRFTKVSSSIPLSSAESENSPVFSDIGSEEVKTYLLMKLYQIRNLRCPDKEFYLYYGLFFL